MKITNKPKPLVPSITKEERKALNNFKKDDNYMVLTAGKGLDLVVMDKDMYIENVWPNSITKMCTKSAKVNKVFHAKVLKQLLGLKIP